MGAPRDIPSDAVIHESVYEMVQAGILDQEPRKGGDNSHLPTVDTFKTAFSTARKKLGSQNTDGAQSGPDSDHNWATSHDGAVKPANFDL